MSREYGCWLTTEDNIIYYFHTVKEIYKVHLQCSMNMAAYKRSRVVGLALNMKGGQSLFQAVDEWAFLFMKPCVKGIIELGYLGMLWICTRSL